MQLQSEKAQEKIIEELQHQIGDLKAENFLLQEQLARKEQATAMIAHDLRGPLSPIINYAQMIARYIAPPKDGGRVTAQQRVKKQVAIQRNTNIIISQARRMSRLVNDLLDSSHLASGKFTLLREECDIVQLIQDLVEQLRPVAPYHTLLVSTPLVSLTGRWDSDRLQQALGNLLDNAIKYSDEHTTITVTIATHAKQVHVSVHNQGASIPPAEVSQLFRPYTRLQAASSRHGSGLGLFITKSIIEAHGGTLQLEPHSDEKKGEEYQGTTFTFELPLPIEP